MEAVKTNVQTHPDHFTEWFKIALPKVEAYIDKRS
jgi:hypothetical protein